MYPDAQRQKRRDVILLSLNTAIEVSNVAKEACNIAPAKAVFGSFSLILTMIRVRLSTLFVLVDCRLIESIQDSMTNEADCVELGKTCADVCVALSRGLNGKLLKDISDSASEAVKQLTTWVTPAVVSSKHTIDDTLNRSTLTEIEVKITKRVKRNAVSRLLHAKNDKETIAGWKSDLNKILLIFNVSSLISV